MDKILHDPKDLKLWELWYIPFNGSCRILSISRIMAFPYDNIALWARVPANPQTRKSLNPYTQNLETSKP